MQYSLIDQLGNIQRLLEWHGDDTPPAPLDTNLRWVVIDPVAQPVLGAFQSASQGEAVLGGNGKWTRPWLVRDWSQGEIDAYKTAGKISTSEAIIAERDRRLDTGGYSANGHWFNSDIRSKGEQTDLALQADEISRNGGDMTAQYVADGVPVAWHTMDNGFVAVTANLAIAIREAARAQTVKTYKAAATHQYYMNLSPNPAAYDFSTGWPLIFGE